MKQSDKLKMIIRNIVREEVKKEVTKLLVESKQPMKRVKPKQKKQYTSNSILNEILNETDGGIPQGTEAYPTMGGGTYDTSRMSDLLQSSYGDIMDEKKSNADILVGRDAPENIKNMFDKDYSGILKASIKKSNNKR